MLHASIVHCWHSFGASLTLFRYMTTTPVSCRMTITLAVMLSRSISQKDQGHVCSSMLSKYTFGPCLCVSYVRAYIITCKYFFKRAKKHTTE
jgi:hypothetical protein